MDILPILKELIEIDSPSGYELEVSNYIYAFFKNLKLNPSRDSNNMIYCLVKNGEIGTDVEPKLFCAHMDTVEPGRGIKVIQKDGYVASDGQTILGADNKLVVAILLALTKKFIETNENVYYELLFTVREETDSGIQVFDFANVLSKTGFVFDGAPRIDLVNVQCPTILDFIITIKGKGAHAGAPGLGINPLIPLFNLKDLPMGRVDKETTFNIGLIDGGTATNTSPDSIVLKGDPRSLSHEKCLETRDEIEVIIKRATEINNCQVNFEWTNYSYAYNLDVKSDKYRRLMYLYKDMGIQLIYNYSTGGSDASYLNHIGIDSFCLGYGVLNAHTVDERVSIENINLLTEIIDKVIKEF